LIRPISAFGFVLPISPVWLRFWPIWSPVGLFGQTSTPGKLRIFFGFVSTKPEGLQVSHCLTALGRETVRHPQMLNK